MTGRIALLLAAGVAVQGSAAANPPSPPPLLFDCRDQEWSVQLFGMHDGRLVLATNAANREAAAGNAQSSWDEIREGRVIGQGGGHQRHIRLYDGIRHIVLLEGMDGNLADRPGRTYAGALTITPSDRSRDFVVECAASETNANLVESLRSWAGTVGAALPAMEDEDGPFDGWF